MRAFLLIIPLLGCVESMPPRQEGSTPRSVQYCYSPAGTGAAAITQQAQAYCQALGLNARKSGGGSCRAVSWSLVEVWERATFDCVP